MNQYFDYTAQVGIFWLNFLYNLNHSHRKPVLDRFSTNAGALISPPKVNGIVKVNTNSLKDTCEYAHYWQWKKKKEKENHKYMTK